MTLAEIEMLDKEMLTPDEVSTVMGCHPQCLRIQARKHPEQLGFAVSVVGTRVKIPRRAFIAFMKGAIDKADA